MEATNLVVRVGIGEPDQIRHLKLQSKVGLLMDMYVRSNQVQDCS